MNTASCAARRSAADTSTPTSTPYLKTRPPGSVPRARAGPEPADAPLHAVLEAPALGRQLLEPPLDHPLLDLEVRHAEAHQAAAGLVALVDGHGVSRPAQLLRRGQAGRAR